MANKLRGFTALAVTFILFLGLANCAAAQSQRTAPRITQPIDESNRALLKGNTHPLARAEFDQGSAPATLPMERMLMVLQRSPDQEVALRKLIDDLHTISSASFHQWLTPEQFGQQFGVSDADVAMVTGWLATHGFQVNRVAASRMLIEFSGTAGQIRSTFHMEIHKFVVNGEEHWANASDPQIPSALAPVVAGVTTMNNFRRKSMVHVGRAHTMPEASSKVTPQFTASNCNINSSFANPIFANTCFGLGPADFAKIYNVPSTLDGTGQTVAIVGDSDICTVGGSQTALPAGCLADDVLAFRTLFSLPGNNTQVVVDGPDPGISKDGDELEGVLDVEWVGAVAQNATVLYVVAANTEASAGIDLAAERVVDNNLAPVLTESYGACESALGNAGNAFYFDLWEQAAAQGITAILATGDSGSATCDSQDSTATGGATVSGLASTPFNVAVGGTDFDYNASGYPAAFWNTTATNGLSAKGYVPETTWDDTCGQSTFGSNCRTLTGTEGYLLNVNGGGGGQSGCEFINNTGCFGYSTPAWQSGLGVPATGFRYIPDLSLFASPGELSNSFYVMCESDFVAPASSCTSTAGSEFIEVGGTSVSAQAFGGIMALVNQAMAKAGKTARQGNANYALYPLFAAQVSASLSCNSSSSPAASCTFNDITKGTNSVYCLGGSANCNPATLTLTQYNSSGVLTTTPAFPATTGFDEATGLGSVNAANLITNWVNQVGAFASTNTTLCISLTSTSATSCAPGLLTFQHGTKVFVNAGVSSNAGTVTGGEVSLIGSGTTFPPTNSASAAVDHFNAATGNFDFYAVTNGVTPSGAFTNELVGGTYTITGHFPGTNAGSGLLFGVSDSPGIAVNVTPEASTTTLRVANTLSSGTFTYPPSPASLPYGSQLGLRVDVYSTATFNAGIRQEDGTGSVTITDSSAPLATIPLNSQGYAELDTPAINYPANLAQATTFPALAIGNHILSASYAGDQSYASSSTSSTFSLTITKANSVTVISSFPPIIASGTPTQLTAFVDTVSAGIAPTGSVQFFEGSTLLGTANVTSTLDQLGFAAATATVPTSFSALPLLPQYPNSPRRFIYKPEFIFALFLTLAAFLLSRIVQRKRRALVFMALVLFGVGLATVGCGGGSTNTGGLQGTKTITLTATYSGDTRYTGSTSMSVNVVVQQ
jgi:hypothetical protein